MDQLECTSSEAFAKYGLLVSEYLRLAGGSRCGASGDARFRYVLVNGLRTLTHVFRILLLYTRNLDATWYHCQKAAYYYVEFMGQIGADANGFLQLNARDAALFVYKKSVFAINGERRKEFGSVVGQDDRVDNIDTLTSVYGKCVAEVVVSLPKDVPGPSLAEQAGRATMGLSRHLLNLALVGTEAGYRERLNAIAWFDQATVGWGAGRLRAFEQFARKIKSHRPSLSKLEQRATHPQHCGSVASADPVAYVSWLLGRRHAAR